MTIETIITILAAIITFLLLVFAVDWRYFRDWIVVFLFKSLLDFMWGSPVVNLKLLDYPIRLLPHYYNTCILFELWVFPTLCILYNQITRKRGFWPILFYAAVFSGVITALEYPLELYTHLIEYLHWSWFTSFYTIMISFLCSRGFIALYRRGCDHFGSR